MKKTVTYKGPKVGEKVPAFELSGVDGRDFKLSTRMKEKVVLYFYPRDNTPGCTLEGQDFARLYKQFQKAGFEVYGISRDSLASHTKFCQKMEFPFSLLSDEDELACGIFDVVHEKNMYGKKVRGIQRSTFVIDEKGILQGEWRKVNVEGHAQEVLNFVKNL